MRSSADRGRVYRRCGCRDAQHHQLGTRCPQLAGDRDHGTWTFAVDLPAPAGKRTTIRRGGFPSGDAARSALRRMLEGEAGGFNADPNQTMADYLTTWLEAKALTLKPTTLVRYRDYVTHDLIPALGTLRLDDLGYRHIAGFARAQLATGRGRVTLHRCLATLSSALGDAVRQRRLAHNPAKPSVLPRPPAAERTIWTPEEAARFLRHCHDADPLMADFVEVLIGTGMRKGEALGLHWADVHLDEQVLYVRYTLSAINNSRLVITTPKTRSSKNWVALPHASQPPSTTRPHPTLPHRNPTIRSPAWCSPGPTANHCDHRPSWTTSNDSQPRPKSPSSPCTTCATSPPPSPSPQASRSSPSPRPCGTPLSPPPPTSTPTSPDKPPAMP